jgi:hypothetical protein
MSSEAEAVKKYLSSGVKTPFFLVVGDEQYICVKEELSAFGLTFVKVSDFCDGEDKPPNIDNLIEQIKTADTSANGKKITVIGIGEYLALQGNKEATMVFARLKDLNIGDTKAVLLLRGIATQVKTMDIKPGLEKLLTFFADDTNCDLSIRLASPSIGLPVLTGFKNLLGNLEDGASGDVFVNTAVDLDNALFTVHKIPNAYEGVKFTAHGFGLPRTCGNDEQWTQLLSELIKNSNSLSDVFEQYGYEGDIEADFYARVAGVEYRNWLYFIALKTKADTLANSYLRFVLYKTEQFEDFKPNVLNAIIDVPHTDKRFAVFYAERKTLVEKFPESDIANFVVNNRKVYSESIYKLTDGTKPECEEIITWVSRNSIIPQIADIYPALTSYLKPYVFKCGELSDLLTEYFTTYKLQKVYNKLESEFLEKIDELAKNRKYNQLPTRNVIIERLDKTDAYLFWLDALGVEYLAFISELVRNRGLSISVKIAQAELPTITSINRGFFDDWQSDRKEKSGELDEVKHKDAGGYNFKDNNLPIHLAKELDIITKIIDKAATGLALRHYKRFLIVSDHGASRLAVLRKKEEKYETDTKGEHSGRCCKLFEPHHDLPFAAEENGYLVLADYGRFKGSRAANVEVHGGASLEEVVVPIICLMLKDGSVTVKLVDEVVIVDYRTGTEITLFFNSPVTEVSVILSGKRYPAYRTDGIITRYRCPTRKRQVIIRRTFMRETT